MRRKRFFLNTITSVLEKIVTILCGFIMPRLIIASYGSLTNGLVNSITYFLSVITFLEFGVGAVVQAALYEPLANKDQVEISKILSAARRYFRKIGMLLAFYVLVLMIIYPKMSHQQFEAMFSVPLILIISISSFSQYFFGVVNSILLRADQQYYVVGISAICTQVLNTFICVLLIRNGVTIHGIKIVTALIFCLRPFILSLYIKRRYRINWDIIMTADPIPQKWNAMAHHISAIILVNADVVILTLFSTLENVSIYSVYNLVMNGLNQALVSLTSGFEPLLGELWIKQDKEKLERLFGAYEWLVHFAVSLVFSCAVVLLIPFIKVYTKGINDIEYIQPGFAFLITAAMAIQCIRIPYMNIIWAAGHFKQTQKCFMATALMNVVLSCALVGPYGLSGVAIGTLVSIFCQMVWVAYYVSKELILLPFRKFTWHIFLDTIIFLIAYLISSHYLNGVNSFLDWIEQAIIVFLFEFFICSLSNFLFYKSYVYYFIRLIKSKFN